MGPGREVGWPWLYICQLLVFAEHVWWVVFIKKVMYNFSIGHISTTINTNFSILCPLSLDLMLCYVFQQILYLFILMTLKSPEAHSTL